MIGGSVNREISSKTWFYNHTNTEFTPGPELKQARKNHAAGVVTDKKTGEKIIVVSGGYDPDYSTLKSTELLIDRRWQKGKNKMKIMS